MATQYKMLNLLHIFGMSGGVRGALHFVDENLLVYPCGHCTVFYNIETREQTLLPNQEDCAGITAMALSGTRRFLAVAERGSASKNQRSSESAGASQSGIGLGVGTGAVTGVPGNIGATRSGGVASVGGTGVINIYDCVSMKRRKVLMYSDLGSDHYSSVAFSSDGKFCLSQGGAPEWLTVLWAAEKAAKILCTLKTNGGSNQPVNQADFCPNDSTIVCISGMGLLKFFRVSENQFRTIPVNLKGQEPGNFLCHAWANDERVLACTSSGDIMVIDSYELKSVLNQSNPAMDNVQLEMNAINAIVPFSKGFLCGGAGGALRIYERSDDPRELYKCVKVLKLEDMSYPITTLMVSPSEDMLACCTSNNQMYSLTLSNADVLKEDSQGAFTPLPAPFHGPGPSGSSQITGLDTCIWKPLVATCGLDKSVRLWNYQEKTMEVMKYFSEEAYSIALHPAGFFVVVGFTEKVKYMSILMDDIRMVKEFPIKGCREIKFSNGGEMFAVTSNSAITIYNSITFEIVQTLRHHNGKVRSLIWHKSDLKLFSCGMDGACIISDVMSGIKEQEFPQGRYSFHTAAASPDWSRVFIVGSEGPIKDFDIGQMAFKENLQIQQGPYPISTLSILPNQNQQPKAFFASTQSSEHPGMTYAFKIVPNLSPIPETYIAHGGGVTCMGLSHDNFFLFTASEDGSLAMYLINDIDQRGTVRLRDQDSSAVEFTEEILVTKADLDDKEKNVASLKSRVDELSLNNEYQMRLKDMNYTEKTKEVTSKFQADVEMDRRRYEELLEEKRNMELEYEERIQDLEHKHKKEYNDLETTYKNKINAEVARFQQLKNEEEEQNRFWDEENQTTLEHNEEFLDSMKHEYETKVETEQSLQKQLADEKKNIEREFVRLKTLIEEDADMEIDELKQKYMTRLQTEKDSTLRLKGENSIMKKKYLGLQKDVSTQQEDIKGLQEKEKELHEVIHGLEKDIQGHKKEIREREETIADKEKRIYDLKKKNQELEKFKFVLDYKIKELKRQIEPRENEISDMRNQIEEMDLELEQYHKSNSALDLMIGELRLKMDGMQKEIGAQQTTLRENSLYIDRYRRDLHQALQNFTNHKKLKKDVVALYKQYVQEDVLASASFLDGDAQREYNRQRENLERNVAALKRNIAKDFVMQEKDTARLRRENITLTKEINLLRREAKVTNLSMKELENELQNTNIPFFSRGGTKSPAPSFGGTGSTARGGGKSLRTRSAGSPTGMRPVPPSQALMKTTPGSLTSIHEDRGREIEMQRQQISQLEEQYRRLQEALTFSPRVV